MSDKYNTCMTSSWMQRNMFIVNRERRLTEAELRVRRSIEKLSIPDWYLNRNSTPPKFLKNHSSFEPRSPPPWKTTADREPPRTNPVLEIKNPSDNRKVACSDEMEKINDRGDKAAVSSPAQNSPKRRASRKKNPKAKPTMSSCKTFPRLSPSRRIDNINIVLPRKPLQKKSMQGEEISKQVKRIDQFVERTIQEYDKIETTVDNALFASALGTPCNKSNDYKSARSDTLGVPDTPRFETPRSQMSKTSYTSTTVSMSSSVENTSKTAALEIDSSMSKNLRSRDTPRSSGSFSFADSDASSETSLFASSKKSSELQRILKKNKAPRTNKSLLETIMQELDRSCKKIVKSTYVSPGSRDHVKKLIRSFETGQFSRPEEEEEEEEEEEIYKLVKMNGDREHRVENVSMADTKSVTSSFEEELDKLTVRIKEREDRVKNDSVTGMKSVSSLTSIRSKDLDGPCGSEFERQLSPILRNAPLRASSPHDRTKKSVEDEKNQVYWISLPRYDLPRSSSLLSIMSRMSHSSSSQSPCVSPIERPKCSPRQFDDTTRRTNYARKNVSKRLFQNNEKTVIDSGYSDRSRSPSACSSTSENSCYGGKENIRVTGNANREYELSYRTGRLAQLHFPKRRA